MLDCRSVFELLLFFFYMAKLMGFLILSETRALQPAYTYIIVILSVDMISSISHDPWLFPSSNTSVIILYYFLTNINKIIYSILSYYIPATIIAWVTITLCGDSTFPVPDPDNENKTIPEKVARLPIHSWYPWDCLNNQTAYMMTFVFQVGRIAHGFPTLTFVDLTSLPLYQLCCNRWVILPLVPLH